MKTYDIVVRCGNARTAAVILEAVENSEAEVVSMEQTPVKHRKRRAPSPKATEKRRQSIVTARATRAKGGGSLVQKAVLNFLADKKPHSYREICAQAAKAGFVGTSASPALTYLKKDGLVTNDGNGTWKLA